MVLLTRREALNLRPEGHFPTPVQHVRPAQKTSLSSQVEKSNIETSTELLSSCPQRCFTPGGGVSCAKPGGRSGKSCAHSRDTGTVWLLCVCGSVSSARLSGRTSTCSLPTCTCRVSPLHIAREKKIRFENDYRNWKVQLLCHQGSYRCVSCGGPLGESSWCILCCSRKSHNGEFDVFSASLESQQAEDALCLDELWLMGCFPFERQRKKSEVENSTTRGSCFSADELQFDLPATSLHSINNFCQSLCLFQSTTPVLYHVMSVIHSIFN